MCSHAVITDVFSRRVGTLEKGLKRFDQEATRCKAEGRDTITGDVAFFLYGTLGFPFDLTEIMAEEAGLKVDKEGFEKCMEKARLEAKAVVVGTMHNP